MNIVGELYNKINLDQLNNEMILKLASLQASRR